MSLGSRISSINLDYGDGEFRMLANMVITLTSTTRIHTAVVIVAIFRYIYIYIYGHFLIYRQIIFGHQKTSRFRVKLDLPISKYMVISGYRKTSDSGDYFPISENLLFHIGKCLPLSDIKE